MKKIIINNVEFPSEIGLRVLKLKYSECPFPELEAIWNDIKPLELDEILGMPVRGEQQRFPFNMLSATTTMKTTALGFYIVSTWLGKINKKD